MKHIRAFHIELPLGRDALMDLETVDQRWSLGTWAWRIGLGLVGLGLWSLAILGALHVWQGCA